MTATVAATLVAVSLPVGGAIHLALRASADALESRATLLASGILRHFDEAGRQALRARDALARTELTPCSPASIDEMRRQELSSSYLTAVGYVQDDRLLCTGQGLPGDAGQGIVLPAPDYTSGLGNQIRRRVALPGVPDQRFVVAQDPGSGLAVLISESLGFDLLDEIPGLSVGVFSRHTREVIIHRGFLAESWLKPRLSRDEGHRIESGHLIAQRESKVLDLGVYAALPLPPLRQRLRSTALVFLPIGLIVSAVLVFLIVGAARAQLSLRTALQIALRRDEISIEYQPVVELATGRVVGAEALARWRRPDGQEVGPGIFVPMAEETGLIGALTARVFELVGRDVGRFPDRGGFHLAINVSADDLGDQLLVDRVRDLVERSRDQGITLLVEATERGLIDQARCRAIVRDIRAAGACVALDDFGTGYSSLSYLQAFELDFLKIDKSFIDAIATGSATSGVVEHIIELARTLGLEVIAEGVESSEQAQYLAERGVRYAQGWLFGRPRPIASLLEQVATERTSGP